MNKFYLSVIALLLASSSLSVDAIDVNNVSLKHHTVAKAPIDGCYYGLGDKRNYYKAGGLTNEECIECQKTGGKLKTNQSYVWGLTTGNSKIYWGTNSNYLCTSSLETLGTGDASMGTVPFENRCYVCEFAKSASGRGIYSDWYSSRIYCYDPKTKTTTDLTPPDTDPNLAKNLGLRSAGTLNNVTFVAGPNLDKTLSFFAYDNMCPDNKFLGSWTLASLPGFESRIPFNIRRWAVLNGQLYMGVEWKTPKTETTPEVSGGAVLRWKGNISPEISSMFEVIAWLEGGVSELVAWDSRLYTSTWPSGTISQSPLLPAEGKFPAVTNTDVTWKTLFSYKQYDPDPVLKMVGAGGAMAVYKDQLYFGTMHMPMVGKYLALQMYKIDQKDPEAMLELEKNSHRAAVLFRLSFDKADPEKYTVELLYGESELPAYNPATKKWVKMSTNMTPLYGHSGIDNPMNNYIWSMHVFDNKLFVGTMDWLTTWELQKENVYPMLPYGPAFIQYMDELQGNMKFKGFDFYYFDSSDTKPKQLTLQGFENETQYGIRNMINNGDKLYLGTASPLNISENAGWELIELDPKVTDFKVPQMKWNVQNFTYGTYLMDTNNLPDFTYNGSPVEGAIVLSLNSEYVKDMGKVMPGVYNFRIAFEPKDKNAFASIKSMKKLQVDKAILKVTGDTIEVQSPDPLPEKFTYKMSGFVFDDNENILDQKPKAYLSSDPHGVSGEYQIIVDGGLSKLYDFDYINGLLNYMNPTGLDKGEDSFTVYYSAERKQLVVINSGQPYQIALFDINGKEVYRAKSPDDTINLSFLPSGVYIVHFNMNNENVIRKIMVNK